MSAEEVIDNTKVERFYVAALLGLRYLDAIEGRELRFGSAPDARWDGFGGHLELGDRIDLLCRDGSVNWGAAFSPSLAFALPGLAPDDAFGPDWLGVDADTARRLWREAEAGKWTSAGAALDALGAAIGREEGVRVVGDLDDLQPTSRLVVAGLNAISEAGSAFASNSSLRWAEQVTVVADRPEERQLAGLVAPLLQAEGPTRIVAVEVAGAVMENARKVISDNASPAIRTALEAEKP